MSLEERLPENTPTVLYIEDIGYTINSLFALAQEKWGDEIGLEEIEVGYEHIQVKCFGYDQYDPTDYTNYFVLTKVA